MRRVKIPRRRKRPDKDFKPDKEKPRASQRRAGKRAVKHLY